MNKKCLQIYRLRIVALNLVVVAFFAVKVEAQVPRFELDTDWPQIPLGDRWLTGGLGGMCIDQFDHLYLLNRQNVVEDDLDAAILAPPIIEIDPEGKVVDGWGDAVDLGGRLHDCHVDRDQNIWIVAAATGELKKWSGETHTVLMRIGEPGLYDSDDSTRQGKPLNSDRPQFFLPAAVDVDISNGDIYVADGELPNGNTRIAVLNKRGEFLHQWPLVRESGESEIELPHCLRISNDGLIYICDRRADRIQVFGRDGNLVQQISLSFEPVSNSDERISGVRGNAVVLAFSHDLEQKYLYVVNQNSVKIEVIDRVSGQKITSFGDGPGRYPGQFELPHAIAVDSRGNVYIAEQEGRRVQKFTLIED